jgi:hypothetical protein
VFFAPQKTPPPPPTTTTTPPPTTTTTTTTQTMALTAEYFCKEVAAKMADRVFCCADKAKEAPLPMQAFAAYVFKQIPAVFESHFKGMAMTVPAC